MYRISGNRLTFQINSYSSYIAIICRRDVYSARIVRFRPSPPSFSERNGQEEMLSEDEDDFDERAIWMFEIRGIAFLWHMVRCIMAVLFMVGGKDCGGERNDCNCVICGDFITCYRRT